MYRLDVKKKIENIRVLNTEKHITHGKHLISIEIIEIFETYFYKCVFIFKHNWNKILIVNGKKYNKTRYLMVYNNNSNKHIEANKYLI